MDNVTLGLFPAFGMMIVAAVFIAYWLPRLKAAVQMVLAGRRLVAGRGHLEVHLRPART